MIKNLYTGVFIHSGSFFGDVNFSEILRVLKKFSTICDSESNVEMCEYVVERNNYDLRFWVDETNGDVISEKIMVWCNDDSRVKFSTAYSYERIAARREIIDCVLEYGEDEERAVFYKNNIVFCYNFRDWDSDAAWLSVEGKKTAKKKLGSWDLFAIRSWGPKDKKFLLDAKYKELV